jgi:hypothetical protein
MAKKKKITEPSEIPVPEKLPEVQPSTAPENPTPEEEPEINPEEEPSSPEEPSEIPAPEE